MQNPLPRVTRKQPATNAGRMVRSGVLPRSEYGVGPALTRELAALRDRLDAVRTSPLLTPTERRREGERVLKEVKQRVELLAYQAERELGDLTGTVQRLQRTVAEREQLVTPLGLRRIERRAEALAAMPVEDQKRAFDLAVDTADHDALMAYSLLGGAHEVAARRALAALNDGVGTQFVVEHGRDIAANVAATRAALSGLADLEQVEEPYADHGVAPSELFGLSNSGFDAVGITPEQVLPGSVDQVWRSTLTPHGREVPKQPIEQPIEAAPAGVGFVALPQEPKSPGAA